MWVTLLFPWSSGMVLFCFSLLKSGRKLEIILLPKFDCIMVKVVRDPCQKITLLLLKSKSVRVIIPESRFLKENTYFLRR